MQTPSSPNRSRSAGFRTAHGFFHSFEGSLTIEGLLHKSHCIGGQNVCRPVVEDMSGDKHCGYMGVGTSSPAIELDA